MKIFKDDQPIYLQLRAFIEDAILSGTIPENEALPSLRTMAKDYNLNPITIANALSTLIEEEILFKKRGIGIFVSENAREKIIRHKKDDFLKTQIIEIIRKAKILDIEKNQLFEKIDQIYGE